MVPGAGCPVQQYCRKGCDSPGRVAEHSQDLVEDAGTHNISIGEHRLIQLAGRGLPDLETRESPQGKLAALGSTHLRV